MEWLGQRVRSKRKQLGWSQEVLMERATAVAKEKGILSPEKPRLCSREYIGLVECGKVLVAEKTAEAIAWALEESPQEFVSLAKREKILASLAQQDKEQPVLAVDLFNLRYLSSFFTQGKKSIRYATSTGAVTFLALQSQILEFLNTENGGLLQVLLLEPSLENLHARVLDLEKKENFSVPENVDRKQALVTQILRQERKVQASLVSLKAIQLQEIKGSIEVRFSPTYTSSMATLILDDSLAVQQERGNTSKGNGDIVMREKEGEAQRFNEIWDGFKREWNRAEWADWKFAVQSYTIEEIEEFVKDAC